MKTKIAMVAAAMVAGVVTAADKPAEPMTLEKFAGVEIADAPKAWFDVLADGSKDDTYLYYADIVPGAALSYVWTELVGRMPLKGANGGAE